MATTPLEFSEWLEQADIPERRLTAEVRALLHAVYRFRQERGTDYFSTRLLSHFLLHCQSGLKVAQIARLIGITRPTASQYQGLSSKQVVQQAHHRLDGRPYGKLLPRFAGPIAAFLLTHPHATRADVLDFLEATFAVRVSRIALYHFLKKYGLEHLEAALAQPEPSAEQQAPAPLSPPRQSPAPVSVPPPAPPLADTAAILLPGPSLLPVAPPPPFCMGGRNTPVPSC